MKMKFDSDKRKSIKDDNRVSDLRRSYESRITNSNVRHRRFKEGDLVLRKVFPNTAERNVGKLGANWEGPYKVIKVVRPGSYQIANMQDVKIPRTWNAMHLKKYYH
ncbi:hypothetical protein Bca101_026339 [Brassica carinata]